MERERLLQKPYGRPSGTIWSFTGSNLEIAERGFIGSFSTMSEYHLQKTLRGLFRLSSIPSFDHDGEDIEQFMAKQARLLEKVVYSFPPSNPRYRIGIRVSLRRTGVM